MVLHIDRPIDAYRPCFLVNLIDPFLDDCWLILLSSLKRYILKHYLEQSRQTPYSRGVYESMFAQLNLQFPKLWSRSGPRDYVLPQGTLARWKWWLIRRWSAPERTVRAGSTDQEDQFDGLGSWSRIQRYWIRRWTAEIQQTDRIDLIRPSSDGKSSAMHSVAEGVGGVKLNVAPSAGANQLESGMLKVPFDLDERLTRFSNIPNRSSMAGRPSSQGSSAGRNSAIMVEEESPHWLEMREQGV